MKRLFIIWICILPLLSLAQQSHLMVEGTTPNLYINHHVVPKDNYYSIGRLYNIGPKEIAAYNKLEMDKGLNLGQTVKIPLTSVNFTQQELNEAGIGLIPVYYTVKPKDGLYRVSVIHNKLPVNAIKKWNKLTGDELSVGNHLIVGFLKVKKEISDPTKKWEPANDTLSAGHVQSSEEQSVSLLPKSEETNNAAVADTNSTKKIVEDRAKTQNVKVEEADVPMPSKDFDGGIFKTLYSTQNTVIQTGRGAVFKSSSGWEDGKYYCLHNEAQPQTIVKITNNATGKTIYAKVMDVIPDIRQNKGVEVLISNAAADRLGVIDNKFDCTISYSK